MKFTALTGLLFGFCFNLLAASPLPDSCKIGGFALGCQAYSFNRYTLFEAIDKTKEAGGKTIELFLWQKLSPELPNVEVNALLSDEHLKLLKEKLRASQIRVVSAYFNNVPFTEKDPEAALRKVFDFAKKLDMVSLTGEPPDIEKNLDLVEKLVKEYDIKFCLHNHRKDDTKPEYQNWNPTYTAKLMQGRDPRMGFCLDTGHLVRSGLKPVDALKILKGRVNSLHLKDPISETDHDTIYGEGVGDVKNVLQELKRQKFNGYISIEYEHNWTNSVPDIKKCIEFVRSAELLDTYDKVVQPQP
ncbi:MAG: sugar phosphate isomerase/epimerase [Verrucomicrobiota bacterium]